MILPLHCFLKDSKRAKYTSASDEDALKAYDAKAVEYINSLAANYSESVYAHKINRLKQLATVYDFESAQEVITQLIGDITDE